MPFGAFCRLSIAWPSGLMQLIVLPQFGLLPAAGILLSGNGCPVSGSKICPMLYVALAPVPVVMYVCEKSPARSSAVGKLDRAVTVGRRLSANSCEAKKNSFLLFVVRLSYTFGMTTGPPMLYAAMLTSYSGFGCWLTLRKKSFELNLSRRPL